MLVKCYRYLVKNLVLGYFMAPPNTRSQVLRIVATVLDFNQEERDQVGLESGTSTSGWFRSFLQPGKGPSNMQVQYQMIFLFVTYTVATFKQVCCRVGVYISQAKIVYLSIHQLTEQCIFLFLYCPCFRVSVSSILC
jgi:hypothetical protein